MSCAVAAGCWINQWAPWLLDMHKAPGTSEPILARTISFLPLTAGSITCPRWKHLPMASCSYLREAFLYVHTVAAAWVQQTPVIVFAHRRQPLPVAAVLLRAHQQYTHALAVQDTNPLVQHPCGCQACWLKVERRQRPRLKAEATTQLVCDMHPCHPVGTLCWLLPMHAHSLGYSAPTYPDPHCVH